MKHEVINMLRAGVGQEIGNSAHSEGLGKWLNARIENVTDEGLVRTSFVVRPDMLNPLGIMHGGAMAAIVDEVMGMQVYLFSPEDAHFVAISLHVDFLSKAMPNQRIYATPHITRLGRSVAHASCELTDESGKVIAKASSNFSRLG